MSTAAVAPGPYERSSAVLRPDPIPANPLRALVSPYTWLATVHLITNLPVAVAFFPVLVVLLALSVGLLPLALLGIVVFLAAVYVVRAMSAFERMRFRLTLGMDVPLAALPRRDGWRTLPGFLRSGVVWRQFGYHLVHLPWAVVTFTVSVTVWSVPLVLLAIPFFYRRLPEQSADLWLLRVDTVGEALAASLVGLLLLLAVPSVVRALASVDAALFRSLLGSWGSEVLVQRVGQLEQSRRRVVDSAEAERRRIERDLHDGAQQRLVSLAMTLGRAKAQAGDGVDDRTRALLAEAHEEAKAAIVELRSLTRGLHPPVLADRGLDAALSAIAARSPVPVDVEVDLSRRPSPTVEAMAYFVVAEALANVAKHSGARRASVVVRRVGDVLRVVVRDDGMGGADPAVGSGLSGIADRVAGVDGRLYVESPPGGPTVLTVEIPCAS